jgi:serine/threonine-protein kinase
MIPREGLRPGDTCAGYRIERVIARGGGGALYAAIDPRNDGAVALKVVPLGSDEQTDPRDARARFLREASAASLLRHPDIVKLYGADEWQGAGFIVMELLPGCDLTRYTRPARLLPEPVVLRIGARMADALAYAHGLGIVHRDVKPSNVMVDLPTHQVKLTDFGIARLDEGVRTRSGQMIGTPAFMAPEQLIGSRIDGRADLYGLGVMLFQLLSGRLPYEGDSMGQLLARIARGEANSLGALRPDLPPALLELVSALLSKPAEARPSDGREVASVLRGIEAEWAGASPPVSGSFGSDRGAGAAGDPGHNASP